MPRIRSLKPEFWCDEKVGPLTPIDRLVFLGLISHADDAGRLVDNAKMLDAMIFPLTDDTCRESLDTLARLSRVLRYKDASGQSYIQIRTWDRHQKVDHPSRYVFPAPTEADIEASLAKVSRDTRDPIPDPLPPIPDQRPKTDLSRSAAPKHDRGSEIAAVIAHYQTFHPRARPGDDEKAKIRKRLAEGYTVEDLKDAIDGCHISPHNNGVNDRGRKYQTLELIVRNSSKVNQFITEKEGAGKLMLGDKLSKTAANLERWAAKGDDNGQARLSHGAGAPGVGLREGDPGADGRGLLADPAEREQR